MTGTPRQAAIYTRISQDRDGDLLGITRQREACQELADRKGWEVVQVFSDDDRSAFSGKPRPGFVAMVEAIKAGLVNAVVAWAPARLTRHPRELEDLIDLLDAHKVEVATTVAGDYDLSTSGGRLVARIVGSVARHESEEKSERVRLKMTEIAKGGRFHGGLRPYGYEADGMTIVPTEAQVVRLMARRIAEGAGLRRVQQELNDAGLLSSTGKPWHFTVIRRLLTSPRIAGLRVHQGEVLGEAAWPAIVDRAAWEEVQAILTDPRRKHQRPVRYLLTGLLETPEGVKLGGAAGLFGGPYKRRLYRAPGVSIDADDLDAWVTEWVLQETDRAIVPAPAALPPAQRRTEELERQLEQLAADRYSGEITQREWRAARERLLALLEEERVHAPEAPRVPAGVTAALGKAGGLRRAWPAMSEDARRRALGVVLEKVIVQPVGAGRRVPVRERIELVPRHWEA